MFKRTNKNNGKKNERNTMKFPKPKNNNFKASDEKSAN